MKISATDAWTVEAKGPGSIRKGQETRPRTRRRHTISSFGDEVASHSQAEARD